jgi:hypothetical protein
MITLSPPSPTSATTISPSHIILSEQRPGLPVQCSVPCTYSPLLQADEVAAVRNEPDLMRSPPLPPDAAAQQQQQQQQQQEPAVPVFASAAKQEHLLEAEKLREVRLQVRAGPAMGGREEQGRVPLLDIHVVTTRPLLARTHRPHAPPTPHPPPPRPARHPQEDAERQEVAERMARLAAEVEWRPPALDPPHPTLQVAFGEESQEMNIMAQRRLAPPYSVEWPATADCPAEPSDPADWGVMQYPASLPRIPLSQEEAAALAQPQQPQQAQQAQQAAVQQQQHMPMPVGQLHQPHFMLQQQQQQPQQSQQPQYVTQPPSELAQLMPMPMHQAAPHYQQQHQQQHFGGPNTQQQQQHFAPTPMVSAMMPASTQPMQPTNLPPQNHTYYQQQPPQQAQQHQPPVSVGPPFNPAGYGSLTASLPNNSMQMALPQHTQHGQQQLQNQQQNQQQQQQIPDLQSRSQTMCRFFNMPQVS